MRHYLSDFILNFTKTIHDITPGDSIEIDAKKFDTVPQSLIRQFFDSLTQRASELECSAVHIDDQRNGTSNDVIVFHPYNASLYERVFG